MEIKKIFCEVLSISEKSFSDESQLKDFSNWDSMTHMILIAQLEEEFKERLTGDEIAEIRTMGDAKRYLLRHGADV